MQRLRDISRKKSAELTQLYSQMRWLGQHNADLVLKNIDANTKMTDLGARQQVLEEELARTALNLVMVSLLILPCSSINSFNCIRRGTEF